MLIASSSVVMLINQIDHWFVPNRFEWVHSMSPMPALTQLFYGFWGIGEFQSQTHSTYPCRPLAISPSTLGLYGKEVTSVRRDLLTSRLDTWLCCLLTPINSFLNTLMPKMAPAVEMFAMRNQAFLNTTSKKSSAVLVGWITEMLTGHTNASWTWSLETTVFKVLPVVFFWILLFR